MWCRVKSGRDAWKGASERCTLAPVCGSHAGLWARARVRVRREEDRPSRSGGGAGAARQLLVAGGYVLMGAHNAAAAASRSGNDEA